jgi:transcriptional regulator with XRE-family HTH domain
VAPSNRDLWTELNEDHAMAVSPHDATLTNANPATTSAYATFGSTCRLASKGDPGRRIHLPGEAALKLGCRHEDSACCEGSEVGSGGAAPDFAKLLRRLRASAGLTQEELADAATLSPRTVSDLERGVNVTARAPTARLLAEALNLSGLPAANSWPLHKVAWRWWKLLPYLAVPGRIAGSLRTGPYPETTLRSPAVLKSLSGRSRRLPKPVHGAV